MATRHLRRYGIVDIGWCLLIVLTAAAARIWYVYNFTDHALANGPIQVQDLPPALVNLPAGAELHGRKAPHELDALVHNVKEHQWFGSLAPFAGSEEQTAHVAPAYPWLLAWLEKAPIDLGPPVAIVRWVQCGLGALTAVFYFLFALRAFGSRLVAVLTGLFCALYPFWVLNTAELNDGVLATFLLALAIWLGARGSQDGGAFTSLLYGGSLAGLALVRAALLPFALMAVLWYLLRCRTIRTGWLYAILAFLGFVGSLAPWTIRNWQVHSDVTPVVNSLFLHLWMGNHPGATGGPSSESAMRSALAEARGEEINTTADRMAELPQSTRYRSLAGDVVRTFVVDPAGTYQRRIWAGLYFFFGEDWFTRRQLSRVDPEADPENLAGLVGWLPVLLPASLFFLLLLSVLGWRWTYGWRYQAMPSSLAVLWIPLPYLLSHAEALHGPRLPLDGVLLCYAAFALVYLLVPPVGRVLRRKGNTRSGKEE